MPIPSKQLSDLMQTLAGQGFNWDMDWNANRPENPGGYKQSDQFMGMPITSAANQLSPFAGMAARFMGLDQKLTNALMPGVFSTRGSLFQPTNPANSLINQQLNQQYTRGGAFDTTLHSQMKQTMLEGMYRAQGYSGDIEKGQKFSKAQEAAQAAMSNSLNPMNLAATGLMLGQDFRGMDRALKQGMASSGIMTYMDLPGSRGALSESQRNLIYGGAQGERAYERQQGVSRQNAAEANKALMQDFAKQPSQYGGFAAEGVGQIASEMARTGALDYSKLKKSGGISAQVQKMTKALDPLRELFGDDIPALMDTLDKSLGVNAMATFSPEQIQAKALQLKHTAAVTGTSVEVMGNMIATSQTYFERAGMDKTGGFQAALDATNLLSGKKDTKRLNEQDYRGKTVQVLSAQQERSETKYAAGAYVLWADKNAKALEGKTDAQKMAKFQEILGNTTSVEGMAAKFGFSAERITSMARTAEAKDVRQNTNLASFQLSNNQKLYMADRDRILTRAMGGVVLKGGLAGKSIDEIRAQYKKQTGMTLEAPIEALNAAARQNIGQGFDYTKAEQLGKDMTQARFREGEVIKRSAVDKAFADAGIGRAFGMTGLMEFLGKTKDKKSLATVTDLVGSVMGMPTDNAQVANIIGSLSGPKGAKAAESRRKALGDKGAAEYDKVVNAVLAGTTEGGKLLGTDEKTMKLKQDIMASLADPNMKPEDLRKLQQRADKMGLTVAGEERTTIKQLVHGDKKYKKMSPKEKADEKNLQKALLGQYDTLASDPNSTLEQKEDFKRGIAMSVGAKNAGLDDKQLQAVQDAYAKSKQQGMPFDMDKTLKGITGLDQKKAEDFKKSFEESGAKLGISTKPDTLQSILEILKSVASKFMG